MPSFFRYGLAKLAQPGGFVLKNHQARNSVTVPLAQGWSLNQGLKTKGTTCIDEAELKDKDHYNSIKKIKQLIILIK